MYKKITAVTLASILAVTTAVTPVFAGENQNMSAITKQSNSGITINKSATVVKYDKKDNHGNKNKNNSDDKNDALKDILKYFMDSDDYTWASKSIERLGALGIFSGNGKGYFNPKNNVTHAEAIAMVLKLTGYQKEAEAIKTQPEYFRGKSDPWSYGYLQLALDKGIIIPSEDGYINPMTPAKRHEVAKYVVRALGKRDVALQNMNADLNFRDEDSIPDKSVGYVYVITDLKIMQGSNNQFQPNKPITRAEMAVILDKAEGKTEDPSRPSTTVQGSFISYDSVNNKLTLNVKNKAVVYSILPNVPVYKNSTYFGLNSLKAGDVVKVIVDSQSKIIFVEFVQDGTTTPSTGKLSTETVLYENLPQVLKDRVDALKYTQSFTAFRHNQSIYLIATRGQMPTGGYTIDIKDVYKEVQSNLYNLKAVVDMTNPTNSYVTQVISYPYEIVKLNYFDGIDKVNFVNTSNTLLAQTVVNTLDATQTINGRISSVDATNRIVTILENDGIVRTYLIPTNVQITLNGQSTTLAALTANMTVAITKTNGVITSLAAQPGAQVIETINGKVDAVDATNRIVRVLENDNIARNYLIPANVEITLNNQAITLASLVKDMPIVITKTNGIITKLAATTIALETINGKVDAIDATNRIVRVLENDNVVRTYLVPVNVEITLNNQATALTALVKDMPIVITRTNGIITKLAATNVVETISGKISSVDATNRIVNVIASGDVVRAYLIPTNVEITLNNQVAALTSLTKDMDAVITRTNGVITRLAVQSSIQVVEGILVNTYIDQNRTYISVRVGTATNVYEITSNTAVFYNNLATTIQNIPLNSTLAIKTLNGVVIEVRNK